jgi:Nitrous oxide-stimulated promoter
MDSSPMPIESAAAARRAARLAAPRLARELKTVAAMLRIYCRDHHGGAVHDEARLCVQCADLQDYARKRLAGCTYGAEKPTCVNCPIHCYGRRQRAAMREVMRYAGPRMLWRHPLLAMAHLIDGRRPAPPRPHARAAAPDHETAPPG